MKRIVLALFAVMSCSTGFIACNNGDYSVSPDSTINTPNPLYHAPSSGNFKATINSNSFSADQAFYEDTSLSGVSYLVIEGYTGTPSSGVYKAISFTLYNYNDTGTYKVGSSSGGSIPNSALYAVYSSSTSYTLNVADSGQVVITKAQDNKISGTFHFVSDSITVTDGSFTDVVKQ